MRPVTVKVGPLAAASANAIALTQAGTAGTRLTINGALAVSVTTFVLGVGMVTSTMAQPDMPRRIGITSAGNDSAITFAIAGTNWSGQPISEVLAGANAGTVQSVLDYATVSSIVPSGNTAANVTVGTTTIASSPWVRLDHEGPGQTAIQAMVTGSVVATIEQTINNPNGFVNPTTPDKMIWLPTQDPNGVGFSVSFQSNYAYAPTFARVTLTSGSGSVTVTYVQAGGPGPT